MVDVETMPSVRDLILGKAFMDVIWSGMDGLVQGLLQTRCYGQSQDDQDSGHNRQRND